MASDKSQISFDPFNFCAIIHVSVVARIEIIPMASSTLSPRGEEIARLSVREVYDAMSTPYHPETSPSGFVNMGTAENYSMTADVSAFANRTLSTTAQTFTYGEGPWGSPRLRAAMARHMNRHFHPVKPVGAGDILFANGITSICEMLGFVIGEPGDGILFSQPMYQAFPVDFGAKAKIKCVFAPFDGVDQFSTDGVDKYEAALLDAEKSSTKIRALLVCHPHNPLGQCYPRRTLVALMELCQKHNIHLLMDEVYVSTCRHLPSTQLMTFPGTLDLRCR